jgi:nucleoside-diphosphate-sugar epimerase
MSHAMQTIVVTGTSGFIGRRLVERLQHRVGIRLRLLTRRAAADGIHIHGDLLHPKSLSGLITPNSSVVHLAYLRRASAADNLLAVRHLVDTCLRGGAKRLILCSTADVVGATREIVIDENVCGRLVDEYQRTKAAIEDVVRHAGAEGLEFVILRPTAVVGPGGANLCRLARQILERRPVRDFALRSLQGERRMNLVALDNVVAAIEFLIESDRRVVGETFLVSDDDDPHNDFVGVYRMLREYLLGGPPWLPRIPISRQLITGLLRMTGRPNWNVARTFDDGKLRRMGFRKTASLSTAIEEFVDWFRSGDGEPTSRKVAA